MKSKIISCLFICALSLSFFCGCAGKNKEASPEAAFSAKNEAKAENGADSLPAADDEAGADAEDAGALFEGQDIEGNTLSSDVFSRSKLTMVNVWATYCNPCLSEMPGLGELAAEYDSEDFQIIGVISDVLEGAKEEKLKNARELIQETGADYTHILLNASLYHGLLSDVSAVPTTFFIDQNGNVLDTVVGAMDKSAWEEKINGLLETLS